MPPELSIVKVDKRKYRAIAQENWGLTKEQMKGMHVHHRIPVSDGGTDDPTNLYVCSPEFHAYVWHNGDEFTRWASEGGRKAHETKNEAGKSRLASQNMTKAHKRKNAEGKSELAVSNCRKLHSEKNEKGESILAKKAGKAAAEKTRKRVKLTNSLGETLEFEGLREACRALNLDPGTLYKVCLGEAKSHKGYTAIYL